MNHVLPEVDPIVLRIARLIQQGRDVAALARDLQPGCDSQDVAFLQRCLDPLRTDRMLEERFSGGFDAARARIAELRDAEEIARSRVFEGFTDPEGDDVGVVREVVDRTEHGNALAELLGRLDAALAARQAILDLMAAERIVRSWG